MDEPETACRGRQGERPDSDVEESECMREPVEKPEIPPAHPAYFDH